MTAKEWDAAIGQVRGQFLTPKEQSDYMIELVDICDEAPIDYLTSDADFMLWLIFFAKPDDLLRAAALVNDGCSG